MASSAVRRSLQKSACCRVDTRLDSSARLEVAAAGAAPPGAGAAPPPPPVSVTAPEVTRTSEAPRRWPGRKLTWKTRVCIPAGCTKMRVPSTRYS